MHDLQQLGKLILFTGIVISLAGVVIILLGKIGLFPLPGDIKLERRNWKIYFPIVSCLVISIISTVILWVINYFRR